MDFFLSLLLSSFEDEIITEISPLTIFYEAEQEHQNYYRTHQTQGYCSFVISPKLTKLRKLHADKLKHLIHEFGFRKTAGFEDTFEHSL